MQDYTNDDFDDEERTKSKSQFKREMIELQEFGTVLVGLGNSSLGKLPLDDVLRTAIVEARQIKRHEALRRQMQYIGRLMRGAEYEEIKIAYEKLQGRGRFHVQHQQLAEQWRDRLLTEGNHTITEFMNQYESADAQHLRSLVRSAQKEVSQGKSPAQARKLFRYIRDLLEALSE